MEFLKENIELLTTAPLAIITLFFLYKMFKVVEGLIEGYQKIIKKLLK